MKKLFIGIDLAWSDTNRSAVCICDETQIKEVKMIDSIKSIIKLISSYKSTHHITVPIDAPLKVPNDTGNRQIEKEFIKDFAKYKISMLPVNRKLLEKQFGYIKGEHLRSALEDIGFTFGLTSSYNIIEVYPHSTIAVIFNDNKILPYKKKKGRTVEDIKVALATYQGFLKKIYKDDILDTDLANFKGTELKVYEDKLDSIICAYTVQYYFKNKQKCKIYSIENQEYFITPFPMNYN